MSKRDRDRSFFVPKGKLGTPADGIATNPIAESSWVGWVVIRDPHDGFRRVLVCLPQSVVDAHRIEEQSGPDLRGNLAVQIQTDMMRDAFLEKVTKASRGEEP
jgi:hypothetical protein